MLTGQKILKDLQAVDGSLRAKATKAPKAKAKTAAPARPGLARFKFLVALEGLARLQVTEDQNRVVAEAVEEGLIPKVIKLIEEYNPARKCPALRFLYLPLPHALNGLPATCKQQM
jgi:hypothetical protein